jgi:hypothetical protein
VEGDAGWAARDSLEEAAEVAGQLQPIAVIDTEAR